MTIANIQTVTGTWARTSSTIAISTATNLVANKHVILMTGHANIAQTTDGASSEVQSVSDNMGAWQWFKISEWCNGQGSIAAGVVSSLWLGKPMLEQPGPMSPIITATLSGTSARTTSIAVTADPTGGSLIWVPTIAAMTGVSDTGTMPSLSNTALSSQVYFSVRTEVTGDSEPTYTPTSGWMDGPENGCADTFPSTKITWLSCEYRNLGTPQTSITSAPTGGPTQAHVGILGIFYEGDFSDGHPFFGISCF